MKKIPLTQGKYALVDNEDYEWLNQWKWLARKDKKIYYAQRSYKNTIILMHREIINVKFDNIVDHINHNGLDNRKENLRECNYQQNRHNSTGNKNVTSVFKGVYWSKRCNKWACKIRKGEKNTHLGYYFNDVNAAKMYDYMADKLFGDFAYLNFPNELLTEEEFKKIDNRKKNKSSKYIGVSYKKNGKRWDSTVMHNEKTIYLGGFDNELQAAQVRDQYIKDNLDINKYRLNFKEGE